MTGSQRVAHLAAVAPATMTHYDSLLAGKGEAALPGPPALGEGHSLQTGGAWQVRTQRWTCLQKVVCGLYHGPDPDPIWRLCGYQGNRSMLSLFTSHSPREVTMPQRSGFDKSHSTGSAHGQDTMLQLMEQ